jgi:hypothetical protein
MSPISSASSQYSQSIGGVDEEVNHNPTSPSVASSRLSSSAYVARQHTLATTDIDTLAPLKGFEREYLLPLLRAKVPGTPISYVADMDAQSSHDARHKPGGLLNDIDTLWHSSPDHIATETRPGGMDGDLKLNWPKVGPPLFSEDLKEPDFGHMSRMLFRDELDLTDESRQAQQQHYENEYVSSGFGDDRKELFWGGVNNSHTHDGGSYTQVQSIFLKGNQVYEITALSPEFNKFDYFSPHYFELSERIRNLLFSRYIQVRSWQVDLKALDRQASRAPYSSTDMAEPAVQEYLRLSRTPSLPMPAQDYFEGDDHKHYCHVFAMKLGMRMDYHAFYGGSFHYSESSGEPRPTGLNDSHGIWIDTYIDPIARTGPDPVHQTLSVGTHALTHKNSPSHLNQQLDGWGWMYQLSDDSSAQQVQAFRDNAQAHYTQVHRDIFWSKNPAQAKQAYTDKLCTQIEAYDKRLATQCALVKEAHLQGRLPVAEINKHTAKMDFLGNMAQDLRLVLADFLSFSGRYDSELLPEQRKRMGTAKVQARLAKQTLSRLARNATAEVGAVPRWMAKQLTNTTGKAPAQMASLPAPKAPQQIEPARQSNEQGRAGQTDSSSALNASASSPASKTRTSTGAPPTLSTPPSTAASDSLPNRYSIASQTPPRSPEQVDSKKKRSIELATPRSGSVSSAQPAITPAHIAQIQIERQASQKVHLSSASVRSRVIRPVVFQSRVAARQEINNQEIERTVEGFGHAIDFERQSFDEIDRFLNEERFFDTTRLNPQAGSSKVSNPSSAWYQKTVKRIGRTFTNIGKWAQARWNARRDYFKNNL